MSVGKWDSVFARTDFAVWGDFAFSFLQNFTVQYLENEFSGSQGLSEYI